MDRLAQYYARTAERYDGWHVKENDEHFTAMRRTLPLATVLQVSSVLDVGCGTGRALAYYRQALPEATLGGIDPVSELLAKAREAVPAADIRCGSGEQLPWADRTFDLVVALGIMHHVESPHRIIREMFRVARKAILLSDHNNFAFGSDLARRVRMGLAACGMLGAATFVKQGFRKQGYSQEDGWWYPFSLLEQYRLVDSLATTVVLVPTRRANEGRLGNFVLCQSHLAFWATCA